MSSSEGKTRRGADGRARRTALVAAGALLVAGCGFHLQGSVALPAGLHTVHLAMQDEFSPFAVELRRSLQRSGAELATSSAAADAVVRIIKDRTGRRILSVSARNTPQEYEIYYSIEYAVDRAGKEVVPPQNLELTRNFSFEESKLLAKDREEDMLREEMARNLAGLVVRRLESL